ncbi:MAG: SCO family protein [Catalinimonas sp.]
MQKLLKPGLLVITLLLPVLIYLFLRSFGDNRYDLPVMAEGFEPSGKTYAIGAAPDFTLTTLTGERVGGADVADKVRVVHFVGATCADSCRRVLTELTRVRNFYRNQPDVVLLTHVPDEAEAGRFGDTYGAGRDAWYLLAGETDTLRTLARRYGVPYGPAGLSPLALVDRDGQIRGIYGATLREEVDRLILETQILLDAEE